MSLGPSIYKVSLFVHRNTQFICEVSCQSLTLSLIEGLNFANEGLTRYTQLIVLMMPFMHVWCEIFLTTYAFDTHVRLIWIEISLHLDSKELLYYLLCMVSVPIP